MIRVTIQAALCFCLLPLLVAQQAMEQAPPTSPASSTSASPASSNEPAGRFVTLQKHTRISVVALERVSSETAKQGDLVRFAVAHDVIVNGLTVIPGGTPATGTITKVQRGVKNHHVSVLQIRVREIGDNQHVPIILTTSDPQDHEKGAKRFRSAASDVGENIGAGAFCLAILPLCILLLLNEGNGSKSTGVQTILPNCFERDFWLAAPLRFPLQEPTQDPDAIHSFSQNPCAQMDQSALTRIRYGEGTAGIDLK